MLDKPAVKLDDFAKDRPLSVVVIGLLGTQAIGSVREFMEMRRTGTGLFAYEPPVNERDWFSFYRYRTLEYFLANLLLEEEAEQFLSVADAFRNPARADEDARAIMQGIILSMFMPAEWSEANDAFQTLLSNEAADEEEFGRVFDQPPMQFLLRIALPCLFAHGCLPGYLLWETWHDDPKTAESAIEKLVKLDPRLVRHPYIRRWIQYEPKVAKFRAARVAKWAHSKSPFDKPKADSHYLKVVFSLLSQLSMLLDSRLESDDLKALMSLCHEEIPADLMDYASVTKNETIRREIGKKQHFFTLPARPDQSSYESVRFLLRRVAPLWEHGT